MEPIAWINRLELYLWLFSDPEELRKRENELRARAQAMGEKVLALLAGSPGDPCLPGLDDGRLAVAVRKGLLRNEAFEVLYSRYAEYLASFLSPRWGIDPHTAWDLVHDLFLRLLQGRFAGYEADRPFRPYFHQAARNAAAGHVRRPRGLALDDLAEGLAGPGDSVFKAVADHELQEAFADALRKLPEDEREILERRHVNGQTFDDIEREMGLPYGRARDLLHQGRVRLRKLLRPHPVRATLSC
jgi:RNA polymerase sigma-70 factor, ECF subfamily